MMLSERDKAHSAPDYEYFTYVEDGLGIVDVFGWTRYGAESKTPGQPRQMFMQSYQTYDKAREDYPDIHREHPAFE